MNKLYYLDIMFCFEGVIFERHATDESEIYFRILLMFSCHSRQMRCKIMLLRVLVLGKKGLFFVALTIEQT